MLRQQREELIPVETVLGRAVQENQYRSFTRGDVVQPDAVDASAAAFRGCAGVIKDLDYYETVSERW